MELRHLRYFVAVAKEQNIGRAANILNISQPPLTRQIQQLEDDIGVKLFTRSVKGVELTEAGRVLYEEATNILALASMAKERTRRASQGLAGRFDVGIFGSGVFEIAPSILLRFRNAFPDVKIVLHTMNKGEQIEALRQKRINIGFNRMVPNHADIGSKVVFWEDLKICVHATNPLAKYDELSLSQIVSEPLVAFPNTTRPNFTDFVSNLFQNYQFTPNIAQVVGDAATGIALVSSGFGICIVPESATYFGSEQVKYIKIKDKLPARLDISCLYLKTDNTPILRAFMRILDEIRKENGVLDT